MNTQDSYKKILVVEDDEISRKILELSLANEWHEVTTVINWFQAIEKVKERFFDIIIMDICLPWMDWIETTNKIKDIMWNVWENSSKIIWYTASIASQHEVEWIFDDFLEKPLNIKALKQLIV